MSLRLRTLVAVGAGLAILVVEAPIGRALAAQAPLVGRVTTDGGLPVRGAEIRLHGWRTRYATDSAGWFSVPDVRLQVVSLGVRRIGFQPVAELVRLRPGDTLDIVLERLPPSLDTVTVRAELEEIWERALRRYGMLLQDARHGSIITANDIAERRPQWTSDMLQGQVGFTVIGSGSGAQLLGRARCRPNIFVDGAFAPGFHLNNMQAEAIVLMVLYRNFTALPSQLQVPLADRRCGGIVIHTQR